MSKQKTDRELREELRGQGCEKFTSSAHYNFVRWAPRCPPEAPRPPREKDPLRDGLAESWERLMKR